MQITAVIPAYNEGGTVGQVVTQVKRHRLIDEIIVVSDGSTDDTASKATEAGAKVIEFDQNRGKGAAMQVGIENNNSNIILFLDADLLGLTVEHIDQLLLPIINQQAEMTIGVFADGRMVTDLAQKIAPFLSGQRAVKQSVLDGISDLNMTKFGVEVALTQYIKKHDIKIKEVELHDLSHVLKEEKLGVVEGFKARLRMYWDIAKNFSWFKNKIK
ncbi:glycosyltransferase family 2 protein [Natroniella sulfidigena]|uniref:glycosyltransferase family 2 protein n=1 Tax=Natroniella sulfidigena TaxID=723921 RepID=UPI00200ABA84|nr:glycosyltransferase family 2 protein [Natroniella sulfidigena]MCK8816487.1 glycosyltransferase family 2 protein [Natroniella sulfidigena]